MHRAALQSAPRHLALPFVAGLAATGFALAALAPLPAFAAQSGADKPILLAQASPAPAARRARNSESPLGGFGGDSKEPIKIDADKLDVLDKENRAVFTGNVVAVQGETTVRCSIMTVFYEGRGGQQGGAAAARAAPAPAPTPAAAPGQSNDSSIKKIDCRGPVTVVSKTQAATSDNAVFDRERNVVIMTGNVALNDGPNVTRGERLVYNTVTGVANVENNKGRVQGFFVPNSGDAAKPGAAPATPARRTPPTN